MSDVFSRDALYGTVFYARDRAHALELIERRGLGEELTLNDIFPEPRYPSDWIKLQEWTEAIHAACWLGMVGVRSNTINAFEFFHDQGLIHTLAHLINRDQKQFENPVKPLRDLMDIALSEAIRFEALVPGFARYESEL